jgi:hypothetical protein
MMPLFYKGASPSMTLSKDKFRARECDTHYELRGDLIEHLWALKGANLA